MILAPRAYLVSEPYYLIVWKTFKDLKLARRELADKIIDIFRDCCCAEFRHASGDQYKLPEFDRVFSSDVSRRWFGTYILEDASGQRPLIISTQRKRLEVLDLAAKLINPMPFRAIGYYC